MLGKDVEMEPVITASRGQIEVPSVRPLDIVRGYRVTFDLKPTDESCEGFYYHCLDMQTGRRMQDAELSTSDTALLRGGVLHVQPYFDYPEITEARSRALADALYRHVEWS
jgi:hypothetical protein